MLVQDFLLAENVSVGLSSSSKQQLLRQISEKAGKTTSVSSHLIAKALSDREGPGSTGIGGGVALPHAAVDGLESVFCLVVLLAHPIDFEAVDDEPVDIVILLLTPASSRTEALKSYHASPGALERATLFEGYGRRGPVTRFLQS